MTTLQTDLVGSEVLLREAMNNGLRGVIRSVRTVELTDLDGINQVHLRYGVQVTEGAARGSLLDLYSSEFTLAETATPKK